MSSQAEHPQSNNLEAASFRSKVTRKLPFRKEGRQIIPKTEEVFHLGPHFVDIHTYFENEDVEEMSEGIWFPLSNVLGDIYTSETSLKPKDIYPIVRGLIDALPFDEMGIRSSTLVYKMLNASGVDRRATVSTAIRTGLASVMQKFEHSESVKALKRLQYFSDFDFFSPNINGEGFKQAKDNVIHKLSKNYGSEATVLKEGEPSLTVINTNKKIKVDKNNLSGVVLESEAGFIAEKIPYQQLMVKTETGQRLAIICWTPSDHSDIPGVKDDRLDPEYSISWDWAATGTVKRELPENIMEILKSTQGLKDLTTDPSYKRITNAQGVFQPEDYIESKDDIWFYIPQEGLKVLGKPMEIGEKFPELSAVSQFRLALRATLKGALSEENLVLTSEGRAELASSNPAPALSKSAQLAFRGMSPERFTAEFNELADFEKNELKKEVMESIMMGLFYPGKFLLYANETRIFEFFPQLKDIKGIEWDQVIHHLPSHEYYSIRQHAATHFNEVEGVDGIDTMIQQVKRFNSLIDPYYEFYQALLKVVPDKVPYKDNAYDALDILLDLEKKDFEPMGSERSGHYVKTGRNEVYGVDIDALLSEEAHTDDVFNKEIEDARKWLKRAMVLGGITTISSLTISNSFLTEATLVVGGVVASMLIFAKKAKSIDGILKKELEKHMASMRLTKEEVDRERRPRG